VATNVWKGGAPGIAQVATWTFTVTWLSTDTVTVTIGQSSYTIVTGSTVIATIVATVAAALAALSNTLYPEFAEITWTATATAVVGTAVTPGYPFTAVFTTNSGSGVITLVATTASSGPNDISTALNWSLNAVPVATNDIVFEDTSVSALYGMATLAAVTPNSVTVRASFTGALGLPSLNTLGAAAYPEYRQRNFQFLGVTTTVDVGIGTGGGAGRVYLDAVTGAAVFNVWATGSATDANTPTCLINGTNTANVLNVYGNSQVGVGYYGGQAPKIATCIVSSGASVYFGPACTLDTVVNNGGTLTILCTVVTAFTQGIAGGTTTFSGAAACPVMAINGGTVAWNSSGTIGATSLTLFAGGTLDFSQDSRAKVVGSSIVLQGGGKVLDPNVVANPSGTLTVECFGCDVTGCQLGVNVTVARTAPA
jgi:hypothetical protein